MNTDIHNTIQENEFIHCKHYFNKNQNFTSPTAQVSFTNTEKRDKVKNQHERLNKFCTYKLSKNPLRQLNIDKEEDILDPELNNFSNHIAMSNSKSSCDFNVNDEKDEDIQLASHLTKLNDAFKLRTHDESKISKLVQT